ncbi:hypothetical protein [Bradyrhizobium sp. 2TAF24]|uniref:hypothetical protein n=1 Tax=Bradyrhizobium sp. 2TAF24 TaxID=3233011 RepID=UPI003F92AB79
MEGIAMLPFILAQESRASGVTAADADLESTHQRDLAFFTARGIDVSDISASLTWTKKQVTKSTGTPPEGPFIDSDEKTYNEPDEDHSDQ